MKSAGRGPGQVEAEEGQDAAGSAGRSLAEDAAGGHDGGGESQSALAFKSKLNYTRKWQKYSQSEHKKTCKVTVQNLCKK